METKFLHQHPCIPCLPAAQPGSSLTKLLAQRALPSRPCRTNCVQSRPGRWQNSAPEDCWAGALIPGWLQQRSLTARGALPILTRGLSSPPAVAACAILWDLTLADPASSTSKFDPIRPDHTFLAATLPPGPRETMAPGLVAFLSPRWGPISERGKERIDRQTLCFGDALGEWSRA